MFGRIFPISVGVRAHFASGPHALSRLAAREKFLCTAPSFFARFMNNTSESGLLAPLSFLLSIAGARSQILEIHVENTCTNQTSDRRPTDRRAARGEENFGVGRRSVGNSLFLRRVRSLFPCFGAVCRNQLFGRFVPCNEATLTEWNAGQERWNEFCGARGCANGLARGSPARASSARESSTASTPSSTSGATSLAASPGRSSEPRRLSR